MARVAKIKKIEVSDRDTNAAVLAFNGKKFRFNGYQLHALQRAVNKLVLECSAGLPEDEGVEVSGVES